MKDNYKDVIVGHEPASLQVIIHVSIFWYNHPYTISYFKKRKHIMEHLLDRPNLTLVQYALTIPYWIVLEFQLFLSILGKG